MAWRKDDTPTQPGLLASQSPSGTNSQAKVVMNRFSKWHLRPYQKVLIGVAVVFLAFTALSTTLESRHDYLHMMTSTTSSTESKPSFIHDIQPPPFQSSRVRAQTPMKPFKHDSEDINPTMPLNATKSMVIASHEGQDLDWLDELGLVSPGWDVYRYTAVKPTAEDAPNLSREAGAYLQYIVDHYHNLTDYTIFSHGHDRAWHQPMRLLDKVVTLNWTALEDEHYMNLRCTEAEGCTEDTKYYYKMPKAGDKRWGYKIGKFWATSMRPQIGHMPKVIGRRCCAQFAVDKTAVLGRPRVFYERLLEPLVNKNLTELKQYWGEELPEDRFATLFEMTWHIIFGKNADHCPSRDYCNKVHFQNKISCDRDVNGYKDSDGWEKIKCTNDLLKKSSPTDD